MTDARRYEGKFYFDTLGDFWSPKDEKMSKIYKRELRELFVYVDTETGKEYDDVNALIRARLMQLIQRSGVSFALAKSLTKVVCSNRDEVCELLDEYAPTQHL